MRSISHQVLELGVVLVLASLSSGRTQGQVAGAPAGSESIPIATKWVLQGAKPPWKNAIKSVLLMECSTTNMKGTAFLLKGGTVVSNEHVVRGCTAAQVWAQSPMGNRITFSKLIVDADRDLAILRPTQRREGGLELDPNAEPPLKTQVSTWGYPFSYEGYAPVLSMGYVAGYNPSRIGSRTVKHVIVNGAFNPGNSGGPLLSEGDNKVVGVVVTKWTLFSPLAETVIQGLQNSSIKSIGTFSVRQQDGTEQRISNEEATAAVLKEFYEKVQVMLGEAISVSELREFLAEKENELR